MNAQLPVNGLPMVMDRAGTDLELLGRLFVGKTAHQKNRDIQFASGQVSTQFAVDKTVQTMEVGFDARGGQRAFPIEGLPDQALKLLRIVL